MTRDEQIARAVIELKPCPFCGSPASIYASSDHSTAWEGGCSNDKCKTNPYVWEETKELAFQAWNTRSTPISDLVAALPKEEGQPLAAAYCAANDYINAMLSKTVSPESLQKIADDYWRKVKEVK